MEASSQPNNHAFDEGMRATRSELCNSPHAGKRRRRRGGSPRQLSSVVDNFFKVGHIVVREDMKEYKARGRLLSVKLHSMS